MGDLLSIRKFAVRETAKQPQFNNAHAIRVLAEQNSWVTCGSPHQRLWSCALTRIFWPNFDPVVRWALRDKAIDQQCTCHYCPTRAIQLGDLRTTAPTILDYRREFFLANFAAVLRWAVREKRQSSTMHVPLLC